MSRRRRVVITQRPSPRAGIGYDSVRSSYYESGHPVTWDRGSAYSHDKSARYQQLSMARDLSRNNYLFKAVVNAVLNHLVGAEHVNIQIRSDSQGFSEEAESYIKEWLKGKPETRNRYKNNHLWRAIAKELVVTGETIILKTNTGQVQLIESELLGGSGTDNPDGILFDGDTPIKYFLRSYDPQTGQPDPATARDVNAQHIIHHFDNDRISGVRGIPPMQSIFDLLLHLGGIIKSEAQSWEIISRIALIAERNDGPALAFDESQYDPLTGGYVEDMDLARIFHADIGESLSTLERNVPHKNFGETLLEFLRLAGSIFGLPGEFIVANFSRSNYSQSKAATVFAHRGIQHWQGLLRETMEEVIRWKLATSYRDELPDYTIQIYLPGTIHLDPQKESSAITDRLSSGLTTMSAAVGEYGCDYEELLAERKAEIEKAIATAKEIEDSTGVTVPWQLFSGLGNIAGSPRQIDAEMKREEEETEE